MRLFKLGIGILSFVSASFFLQSHFSSGHMVQMGTGWFINTDGYIATANHVVTGAKNFVILYKNTVYPVHVVVKDPTHDIAILKADDLHDTTPIPVNTLMVHNEPSEILGFPCPNDYGYNLHFTQGTASTGGMFETTIYLQLIVCPGNSGGPIVDDKGSCLGVVTNNYTYYTCNTLGCATRGFGTASIYLVDLAIKNSINIFIDDTSDVKPLSEWTKQFYNSVVLIQGDVIDESNK